MKGRLVRQGATIPLTVKTEVEISHSIASVKITLYTIATIADLHVVCFKLHHLECTVTTNVWCTCLCYHQLGGI